MAANVDQQKPDGKTGATTTATESCCDAVGSELVQLTWPSPGVALLTLNLPERRNMMSTDMTAQWVRHVDQLSTKPELRCLVVTGAGTAFSSGGDLTWLGDGKNSDQEALRVRMSRYYRSWLSVRELPVPTVGAINGHAVGAGLALAMACDIRIVSDQARLSVPFTTLGIHPGMGSTWSLPATVGMALATDMLLTGRVIQGSECVQLGLASRSTPPEQVLPTALEVASAVAAQAPQATRLTTRALRAGGHANLAAALEWESLAQAMTLAGTEVQEGLAAVRERRAPNYSH